MDMYLLDIEYVLRIYLSTLRYMYKVQLALAHEHDRPVAGNQPDFMAQSVLQLRHLKVAWHECRIYRPWC